MCVEMGERSWYVSAVVRKSNTQRKIVPHHYKRVTSHSGSASFSAPSDNFALSTHRIDSRSTINSSFPTTPFARNLAMPGKTMQQGRVLGLYRQLLKIGKAMPTETRSSLVLSRVKGDFRANITEKDPGEIETMIQLAELQVDNLQVNALAENTQSLFSSQSPLI